MADVVHEALARLALDAVGLQVTSLHAHDNDGNYLHLDGTMIKVSRQSGGERGVPLSETVYLAGSAPDVEKMLP